MDVASKLYPQEFHVTYIFVCACNRVAFRDWFPFFSFFYMAGF